MKKVAFIGGYDKTDLILYIAKILTVLGNKVLVIDTTLTKKTKYILPKMGKSLNYITTFERIDVAIGFENLEAIEKNTESKLEYDYILIDIDSPISYRNFKITNEDENIFVTAFDLYSLRRGVNVFKALTSKTNMKKVYFSQNMTQDEDRYLNFLVKNPFVEWDKEIIYFPIDLQDMEIQQHNERMAKIRFKGFSNTYLDSLQYLVELISGLEKSKVKRAIKNAESNK